MERLKFRCQLLSDIVLVESPATEGKVKTLTFIPGNNFLGVVAKHLYISEDERSFLIFHSGKVRFGDAHPSHDHIRGNKIPMAIYTPKLSGVETESYVNYLITDQSCMREKQLKQCREGFYLFGNGIATKIEIERNFSIKSAYDTTKRRAADERLYCLESLPKGLVMYFSVEIDEEAIKYKEEIIRALEGRRHIGRSRTAQYGFVEISLCDFDEPKSTDTTEWIGGRQCAVVYADSRLIFHDENGYPTFTPTAMDLGFEDDSAKIMWDKCEVQTFQYAPWNYKLKAYDTERCGFEKGSVFVVETMETQFQTRYVGSYRQEGFGRVIYNPQFLKGEATTGLSSLRFRGQVRGIMQSVGGTSAQMYESDRLILDALKRKQSCKNAREIVYDLVNDFVKKNGQRFITNSKGSTFSSQWGSIRSFAMVAADSNELITQIGGFLDHGVAQEQWEKNDRREVLMKFLRENNPDQNESSVKVDFQELVINLASMMGKYCAKAADKNNE